MGKRVSGQCRSGLGSVFGKFKRLVRAWRGGGNAGLVSRQRGRPSNRRLDDARRAEIAALLRGQYAGFGAMAASETLAALEAIAVSVETVRGMQIGVVDDRDQSTRLATALEPVVRAAIDLEQFAKPSTPLAQLKHPLRSPCLRSPQTQGGCGRLRSSHPLRPAPWPWTFQAGTGKQAFSAEQKS